MMWKEHIMAKMKTKNSMDKTKDKPKTIDKSMSFAEILARKPEAAETLMEVGMHCCGCPMAQMETLEEGCAAHGIDVEEIVKKLNEMDTRKR